MKLIIIDPHLGISSPSMRGVVLALPHLRASGWQIEAWCWHIDADLLVDSVVKVPRLGAIGPLSLYVFGFWTRWLRFWNGRQADVVLTLAPYDPVCDICLVQFSSFDWERRQRLLGIHSLRDVYERIMNIFGLVASRRFLRRTTAKKVLSVSSAVADDLLAENASLNVQILPNCYDPSRFHAGVKAQFRDEMRLKLGYSPNHRVFLFASAGHYRRKGFFLALAALRQLRETFPEIRFLVVGGRPSRLAALQAEIGEKCEWITFTGMVSDVEKYMAAADAFFFPSYSEAFALVEVEAAACGLPLFLTPHHGSEMILEDSVNGRLLPFSGPGIAEVLFEFLNGTWKARQSNMKSAIDSDEFARRLSGALRSCIEL